MRLARGALKAWSTWLWSIAIMIAGVAPILPELQEQLPEHIYYYVSYAVGVAGLIARLVPQDD